MFVGRLRARLDLAISDLGETKLKNITEPIPGDDVILRIVFGVESSIRPAMVRTSFGLP
jgi:hypothetical protein